MGACQHPDALSVNANAQTTTSSTVTLYLREPVNLLVNGSGQAGNLSGWSILANGGNGWTIAGGSLLDGPYGFITSYDWGRRSQEVDLVAAGYTPSALDAQPPIAVREWYHGAWPDPDRYYFRAELRDVNHAPLASFLVGSQASPVTATFAWQVAAHTFTNYGPGARYVYIEDGGDDSEWWLGHYGTMIDSASVAIGSWEMQLSNDGSTWSSWVPFTHVTTWTLSAGAGAKRVLVRFRDQAMVQSGPFVDGIWLQ
jgi:hypothetical protein